MIACVPIPPLEHSIVMSGGDVKSYSDALGHALPEDSNSEKLIFVVKGVTVLVILVEKEGCAKYTMRVPLWKHQQALNGV
jgi:hypothetical protein